MPCLIPGFGSDREKKEKSIPLVVSDGSFGEDCGSAVKEWMIVIYYGGVCVGVLFNIIC